MPGLSPKLVQLLSSAAAISSSSGQLHFAGLVVRSGAREPISGLTLQISGDFAIEPNGRVRGATVVSSGFKGTDVGKCVQKVVGSMTFPKTSASKDVPVTYPFILQPG